MSTRGTASDEATVEPPLLDTLRFRPEVRLRPVNHGPQPHIPLEPLGHLRDRGADSNLLR
ncbi:hypothetical protein Rmet_6563 [Cupriavidus metallidurans CH34]|uniref:Uncharacterized protein n=1 Tax=Cupriavidus metallidurans (strain ATCC 43123 / DSM 2839 / NBRC 102507 / CH34) TaxID=266264 RepID=D3DXZ8_CUPMC|nr:hypothetical protein Rmet_6563 [Cupriavidus metallidurans CH34]